MFLLSDRLLRYYLANRQLIIEDMSSDNLTSSAYYFRLGYQVEIMGPDGVETINLKRRNGELSLPVHVPVRVSSFERFTLPWNVFVLIGNHTELPVERGLHLLHGMSIDPGYRGYLDLTLVNLNPEAITLRAGDRLGKLLFFDVSDTGLEDAKITSRAAARSQRLDEKYDTD